MKKKFTTHTVMTLITGIVMVDFKTVQECMEWVLGHPVWTHEMPSMMNKTAAMLVSQFPMLPVEANKHNYESVLAEAISLMGNEVEVEQGTEHRTANPLETLAAMVGNDKIIAVVN